MWQEIFKEPDYLSMGRSLARTAMLLHDSMSFVMGQMVLDGQRMADCDATRTAEMAKMKSDIGRMTMKVDYCRSYACFFGLRCRCLTFD